MQTIKPVQCHVPVTVNTLSEQLLAYDVSALMEYKDFSLGEAGDIVI